MATLTIRNVPDAVVEHLKLVAKRRGRSMEQEVRELIEIRYAPRSEVTERIRKRWDLLPATSETEVLEWRQTGRV